MARHIDVTDLREYRNATQKIQTEYEAVHAKLQAELDDVKEICCALMIKACERAEARLRDAALEGMFRH